MLQLVLVALTLAPADLDRAVAKEWQKQHLRPGALVDDAAFLRRVTLDLTGTIPSADRVRAFLADRRPDKHARAVDALLAAPEYALHFASYWDRVLMGKSAHGNVVDRVAFARWLYRAMEQNRRFDEVVRELVSASGQNTLGGVKKNALGPLQEPEADPDAKVRPAVNFLLRYNGNVTDLTGKLARAFLGVQIQCAECHDHPSEKWKQDDFRALAACFAKTGMVPLEDKAKGIVRKVELRDLPRKTVGGSPELKAIAEAPPRALDGTDFSKSDNRRAALASWIVDAKNPWFARAVVNRYWALLVGRGFVEPFDDFRRSNPAVMPAVLDALAADFRAGYDLKRLVRLICLTRVYQLAVAPGQPGDADERLFVHHRMRQLTSEELYNALASATSLDDAGLKQQIEGAFDFVSSVDEEAAPPADFTGSIQQALLFLNAKLVNRAVQAARGLALAGILDFPADDALKVDALYLRVLSRPPKSAEEKRAVAYVTAPRPTMGQTDKVARQQAYEDLFWALINSSEFTFQH